MTSIRLSLPYSDDGKICVHVVDSANEPIDLSPFTEITFTLKRSLQDLDSEAVFQGTLTGGNISVLTPTEDGICEVTVPASATAQLMLGKPYYWTCKLTSASGSASTPVFGTFYADAPIFQ
jgi:hypothetical protein